MNRNIVINDGERERERGTKKKEKGRKERTTLSKANGCPSRVLESYRDFRDIASSTRTSN